MWTESSKKNAFLDRLQEVKGKQSLRKFAEKLSMSTSTVAEYMKGREPPVSFVVRICERFEVSPSWLLLGTSADANRATSQEIAEVIPQSGGRIFCLPNSASYLKGCMLAMNIKLYHSGERMPLIEVGEQVLLEICSE